MKTNFKQIRDREKEWKKQGIYLTVLEYNKLYEQQQGCCIICGKHQSKMKKRLAVDHSHETGKVRGLLCLKCNATLGWVEKHKVEIEKYLG